MIVLFIQLEILGVLCNILLKLLDSLATLHRLVSYLPHLDLEIGLLELFVGHGNALFIEFEVGFNKLHEKEIVVVDEGGESGLGVQSGAVRVTLVSYFLPQIVDNLIKSLEMIDVLAYQQLGVSVSLFAHQGVKSLFIVRDNFPSSTYTGKDLGQILYPAVQVLIFKGQLLVFPSVVLQFDGHLRVLLDEKLEFELLVLHELK